jgi:hypothetical protein
MSLDACVYCDCLEMGRIVLPKHVVIRVESDGYPTVIQHEEEISEDHRDWQLYMCQHERHRLCHHFLGNMALIGLLRAELTPFKDEYPLLCEKVIYNGIHAGDWLGRTTFSQLPLELEKLRTFQCAGNFPSSFVMRFVPPEVRTGRYTAPSEADSMMQTFRCQMQQLLEAATTVWKPIAF